jgi:predicted transcriptional regulator
MALKDSVINVRLAPETLSLLKKEAKRLKVTPSHLFRQAIQDKLRQLEREKFVEGLKQK